MMPRFIKLGIGNEIDPNREIVLMKAYEEEQPEANKDNAQYITDNIRGYYWVGRDTTFTAPTEDEISKFARDIIETYRATEKARTFVNALKDIVKDV